MRSNVTVRLCCAGIMLVVAAAAWADPPAAAGGRFALLVGVKKYLPTELRELKYAEADVTALRDVLQTAGYKSDNIMLMTQAESGADQRRSPTAANIRKELKLILEGRTASDVVVIAFAGHGVQFSGSDENFFCPVDAELAKPDTLVSLKEVFGELEKCPASLKLLLVDACRNDPQTDNSRSRPEVKLESVTRPPAEVPEGGIAAFYSCSASQKAYEDDDLKHGVFFHYVIEGLKGAAARDGQPQVQLGDLHFYVNSGVEPFVRSKLGQKQLPQMISKIQGATPPLVTWPQAPATPPGATPYAGFDPRLLPGSVGPTDRVSLPGYATKGHTLKRVWAIKQITNHRPADAPKYAPELVTISADGTKVAAFAPQSGIYTMNPDGTDYKLVLPNDPARTTPLAFRFHLSPDGSRIYWQGNGGPIYRVNADGSDLRELVKSGAEYTPLKLRWWGNRIYYGTRGGLYSIDTEGVGDYREVLNQNDLFTVFNVPGLMFNEFDVSETGERLVCSLYDPDLKRRQLFALPVGSDPIQNLRLLATTEFEPTNISISPDGSRIFFGQYGAKKYVINWDGSGQQELHIPTVGRDEPVEFTPDGRWINFFVDYWGSTIAKIDGSELIDVVQAGEWSGNDLNLFSYPSRVSFSKDLRRFVYIINYGGGAMPRQIVTGEINPAKLEGYPTLGDIEFPKTLAFKPELPNHFGTLRLKAAKGAYDIERIQFMPSPGIRYNKDYTRWENNAWQGFAGGAKLNDAGTDGDATAGDGVWSTASFGKPNVYYVEPRHYLLRIVAHDKTTFRGFERASAVIVDVDGLDVK